MRFERFFIRDLDTIFEDVVVQTSAPRGEQRGFLSLLVVSKTEKQKRGKKEEKAENKAALCVKGRPLGECVCVSISTPLLLVLLLLHHRR